MLLIVNVLTFKKINWESHMKTKKRPYNSKSNNKFDFMKTGKGKILSFALVFAVLGASYALFASAGTARNFGPGEALTRQAAAVFFYREANSPAPGATTKCGANKPGPFVDVPGNHAFCKEIEWASMRGIISRPDDKFKPDRLVTRQKMAAFMYIAAGKPKYTAPTKSEFSDVKIDHPAYKVISWLKANNITSGYADGTYKPDEVLSRQAAAQFMYKKAGSPKTEVPQVFLDVDKNHPFYTAIQWLGSTGVSVGYTPKAPKAPTNPGGPDVPTPGVPAPTNPGGPDVPTPGVPVPTTPTPTNPNPGAGDDEDEDAAPPQATTLYFNPARETSRQAMVAFLYRTAENPAPGNDTKCGEGKSGPFQDIPALHTFCKEIDWANKNGIVTGYADGSFRPTSVVTRQAAAAFLYRLDATKRETPAPGVCSVGATAPYTDVKIGQTFCQEIAIAKSSGWLTGYADGTFRPFEAVTRQAVAAMLYRYAGSPTVTYTDGTFTDVKAADQFATAVEWVTKNGIANGDTKKLTNHLDPLTNHELGRGAKGDIVSNLQSRLRAIGFDALVPQSGEYDMKTAVAVEYWQKLNGLKQTTIFNCGQDTCQINPIDLRTLQENERTGKRFDISPLLQAIEAQEKAVNDREAAVALRANPDWPILEGHYLCRGVNDHPEMVGHLQWRLSQMGYGGMIGGNGDYTRVYDAATAFNIQLWRQHHNNAWPEEAAGCFRSSKMLGQLKKDYDTGFRVDLGPLVRFFTPVPVDCRNPFNQWVNPDCKWAIPPPPPSPAVNIREGVKTPPPLPLNPTQAQIDAYNALLAKIAAEERAAGQCPGQVATVVGCVPKTGNNCPTGMILLPATGCVPAAKANPNRKGPCYYIRYFSGGNGGWYNTSTTNVTLQECINGMKKDQQFLNVSRWHGWDSTRKPDTAFWEGTKAAQQ